MKIELGTIMSLQLVNKSKSNSSDRWHRCKLECQPPNLPFPWGTRTPPLSDTVVTWDHTSVPAKWHLIPSSLPNSVVESNNMNSFKNNLDKFWQNVKFNWKASLTGAGSRSLSLTWYIQFFSQVRFLGA